MQISKRMLIVTILQTALASGLKPLRVKSKRRTDEDGGWISWSWQSWATSTESLANNLLDTNYPYEFTKNRGGEVMRLENYGYCVPIPKAWRKAMTYLAECLAVWDDKTNRKYNKPGIMHHARVKRFLHRNTLLFRGYDKRKRDSTPACISVW